MRIANRISFERTTVTPTGPRESYRKQRSVMLATEMEIFVPLDYASKNLKNDPKKTFLGALASKKSKKKKRKKFSATEIFVPLLCAREASKMKLE